MNIASWRNSVAAGLIVLLHTASFAQMTVPSGGAYNLPAAGSLNLGCTALLNQGNFSISSGQVNNAGGVTIANTGILNGDQGTINVSGNWSNSGTFNAGTGSVVFADGCASGPITLTGSTVFNNLTLSSTSGRTFIIPTGQNITVNGILTLQGASGQPIQLTSSNGSTAVISLGPQAQVIRNFVNVGPDVQIGALASPQSIPTLSELAMILLMLMLFGIAGLNLRSRPTNS